VNATIVVPAGGACFEGHFPGRPILPGVVLLDLALQALAGAQQRAIALRGIAFARLRQLVVPGDRLELQARELDGAQVRIELRRGQELVANAQMILGVPDSPPAAGIGLEPVDPELSAAPALDALLPHRPPMRLVESIVRETVDGVVCTARVPPACALAQHGVAPALAGVEAAAQTAAVWEALRRWRQGVGGAARIGYLVALRDLVLFAEHTAVDAPMLCAVRLEAAAPPLTHYRIETCVGGRSLVRGTIATYLA
jgi:predicted hotdog family 3-hydroxylacyl-ACP dehydratase